MIREIKKINYQISTSTIKRKSQIIKLPVSSDKISQYRNQLIKFTNNAFQSRISSNDLKKHFTNNKTKFNQTKQSLNRAKGISHRISSSSGQFRSTYQTLFKQKIQDMSQKRPSTELRSSRYNKSKITNEYSPLQIINTKLQIQNQSCSTFIQQRNIKSSLPRNGYLSNRHLCQQIQQRKIQSSYMLKQPKKFFLKKGSSYDRTLISNILKSKFIKKSHNTINNQNYSNLKENSALCQAIKKEIPSSMRDFIGVEEMISMSRILTGFNIKHIDIRDNVDKALQRRINIKALKTQQEDHLTLRSIKRW